VVPTNLSQAAYLRQRLPLTTPPIVRIEGRHLPPGHFQGTRPGDLARNSENQSDAAPQVKPYALAVVQVPKVQRSSPEEPRSSSYQNRSDTGSLWCLAPGLSVRRMANAIEVLGRADRGRQADVGLE
jgi:hypothetical protein